MNNPIVSIMLPSRGKPDKLKRCIESILQSASSTAFEIIAWIDDDDQDTVKMLDWLHGVSRVFIGPRLGYDLLDRGYYTLCAYHARAPWVWIFNDDMIVSGDWLAELKKASKVKTFCQPEMHRLGQSSYPRDTRTGCPIFLNGCWIEGGWLTVPAKADYVLTDKLESMGWSCNFLSGVTVWHDHA